MKKRDELLQKEPAKAGSLDRLLQGMFNAEDIAPLRSDDNSSGIMNVLRSYWPDIRPHLFLLILTAALVVGITSLGVVGPVYVKQMIDSMSGSPTEKLVNQAIIALIAFVLLRTLREVIWLIKNLFENLVLSKIMVRLNHRVLKHTMYHGQQFFANIPTGTLVKRIGRYSEAFVGLYEGSFYILLPLIVYFIGTMFTLYLSSPILTVSLFAWAIVYASYGRWYGKWKSRYDLTRTTEGSRATGIISDAVSNHTSVDAQRDQEFEIESCTEASNKQVRTTRFCWDTGTILMFGARLISRIAEFGVYFICIMLWSKGKISVGLVVQASLYVTLLSDYLSNIDQFIRRVSEETANASEAIEILKTEHEIKDAENAFSLKDVKGNVELRNVHFKHGDRKVLNGINLRVSAGESIAFVGRSGAGKSTITKLLIRFFDVEHGAVLVDGYDVKQVTLKSLRENIGYVPQDPLLFHRTIMENIRFGRPGATNEEVFEAARRAHCDVFISRLTNGYNSKVGERGVKLSGGERQRIAIARALLRNAPILIFDEATSALDSESEGHIKAAIAEATRERTAFFVAHRLSTIMDVDRIVVMDEGCIAETGTHDELVELGGIYADLWNRQQQGFIPGPSDLSVLNDQE